MIRGGVRVLLLGWRVLLPLAAIAGLYYLVRRAMADAKQVGSKANTQASDSSAMGERIQICPHCKQEIGSCVHCRSGASKI